MSPLDPELVSERLERIRSEMLDVGRPDIRIVAVTKGFGPDAIQIAQALGLGDIGESYAQELEGKLDSVEPATRVHFIGRVQRNKVRRIADRVGLWHGLAREEVAREIGRRRVGAECLIQVRVGGDETKDGVAPEEVEALLASAREAGVLVTGLMTIGVHGDSQATRDAFRVVDELARDLGLPERSMGMSADYLDAAAAGATMIRLGTALFGPRG